MENQAFKLLMDKLQGIDRRLEDGDKKFDEFHVTLQENTRQVGEYIKGYQASDKRLKFVEDRIVYIDKHVDAVQKIGRIISPTKKKMVWSITAITLFFGIIKFVDYCKIKTIL